MAEDKISWCRVCCTRHEPNGNCPGELLASGPERHGWRVLVDSPRGPEVYGTLVAPSGDRWRARILTYPRVLWVVPGGTMKFVGSTPAEAQERAVEYIRAHCKRLRLAVRTEVATVEDGVIDLEQDEKAANSEAVRASQRKLRKVSIRYGISRPTDEGETDDLSEGGLFVKTDSPLKEGTDLVLRLEIEGFGIPLGGRVRWVREHSKDGKPGGMGIKLIRSHPRYVHYIRQQRKKPEPEESGLEEVKRRAASSVSS